MLIFLLAASADSAMVCLLHRGVFRIVNSSSARVVNFVRGPCPRVVMVFLWSNLEVSCASSLVIVLVQTFFIVFSRGSENSLRYYTWLRSVFHR